MENERKVVGEKIQTKMLRKTASHIGFALSIYGVASYAAMLMFEVVAVWILKSFTAADVQAVLNSPGYGWLSMFVCQDIVALAVFFFVARLKKPIGEVEKSKRRLSVNTTAKMFLVCVAVMQIGSYLSSFLAGAVEVATGIMPENTVNTTITQSSILQVLVMSVAVAPVVEEIVYRKFVIKRLAVFGEGFAVVVSAALFALAHGNLYQVFYAFGVGVIFGYVYIRTNNLKISILFHMAVNFTGAVVPLLFLKSGAFSAAELSVGFLFYLIYLILLFGCTAVGVWIFFANIKRIKFSPMPFDGMVTGKKVSCLVFNAGMIIFFLMSGAVFALSI